MSNKYVLGVSLENDSTYPVYLKSFQKELDALLENYRDDIGLNAIKKFYQSGEQLEAILKSETFRQIKENNKNEYFSFRLDTESDSSILIANRLSPKIEDYLYDRDLRENQVTGICSITGEESNLCRIHESIDIINASLISFQKNSGYDSYGKEQGLNAPISLKASDAIHSALNTLIRYGENTNFYFSGITYLFWSKPSTNTEEKSLEKAYKQITFDFPEEKGETKDSYKNRSKELLKPFINVIYKNNTTIYNRNIEDRFYILGLTPNKSRVSVVLWQEGTIYEIINNTFQHLQDMNIIESDGFLSEKVPPLRSVKAIMLSISKKKKDEKKDTWSKLMIKNIVRSMVCQLPYPREMQLACLERIRASRNVSTLRAAILKAYLIRSKTNNYHITMALDKSNTEVAYLLGRLFSLLENTQSAALGKDLNATIRDRFYSSSSTAPSSTFGQLMKLYTAHLSKAKRIKSGIAYRNEKIVDEIFTQLPPDKFPARFNADEQSLFAIGYYHQRVDLYHKKEKNEDE